MKSLIKTALIAAWAAVSPVHPALVCAVAMPVADMLMAMALAIRSKKPLTSGGMKRTVAKIAMYLAGILFGFAAEQWLGVPYASRIVTVLVGSTELKSCLEHLDELNGSPVFASILTKLALTQDSNDSPPPPSASM